MRDCGAAVLTVVDDEVRLVEVHLEYAEITSVSGNENYDFRFALSLKNVGTFLDLTGGSRGGNC